MGNDVRIRVHWEDPDGSKFQKEQTAKAKKAGAAAGDEFAKTTREKVRKAGSDAADDFDGSFSGKLTKKSITAAQKAGEDAAKSFSGSFSGTLGGEGVEAARGAGEKVGDAFGEKLIAQSKRGATKATSTIERELAASEKKIAAIGEEIGDAAGQGIENGAKNGARRGGQAVDGEMSRVAGRANKAFDAKLFTGLSIGLPAAAAAGAVGASLALALPGAAVVGVSALILRNNEKVQGSFNDLSNNVIADSEQMAQVMAGPLANAGSDLQASWNRLRPLAQSAFRAAVPEVETLTGVVTDLAEGALPGMVTGLKASHPALLGLRVLSGEVGQGLGEMFANASKGSAGAGQGMTVFAGTLRLVEGRVGTLFANLANGSTGPLLQLHVVVDQVTGALVDLTSQGSAAIGFLTGFGSAAGGTVTALRGVLTLVDALPDGVAQFGGSMTAAAMIGNKFGLDLGGQFTAVKDKVKAAGNELSGVERFAAKAGTAVGGLAAAAISPTTLAVAGLATGLMILGQQQQDAAADAAAHAGRERDLAAALRESKGAVTESVRAAAIKQLGDYKVADGTRNLLADTQKLAGDNGVKLLTEGYLGNADASKKLVAQLRQTTAEHTHLAGASDLLFTNLKQLDSGAGGTITAMDDTGFAAKQLADIVEASGGDFEKAKQQLEALGIATGSGAKPMNALESAMEGLKDAASGSEERLSALVDVLNILEGRNATFEESIQSGNDALRSMEDNLKKGVKQADGFGKSLLNADGSVNTFTANGSQLQDLATGLQSSFAKAGGSIDEMVRKGMPFDQAVQKVNEGLQTQRDRFVGIAEKMGLTKTEAQALADKYGLLPQEISTRITADTKQAQDAITALPEMAANTKGAIPISADVNPATGQINTVVNYADGSTGVITVDGNKDPATGKVMVAVQYANGQHTFMTIDAFNQAAKDRTLEAKRNADGTVAYILVDAKTDNANGAIDWAARARTATIYVQTAFSGPNAASYTSKARAVAGGGLVGNAPFRKFAGGGITDIRPGGLLRGPGTGTSDSIMALTSAGPAGVSNGEFVEPANRVTPRTLPILEAIRKGTFKGFADGGMVKYGEVSQARWDALYASGWRGNPNDGMEALYAPAATTAAGSGGSRSRPVGGTRGGEVRVVLDITGGDRDFRDLIRKWVRIDGGGNVQVALGTN